MNSAGETGLGAAQRIDTAAVRGVFWLASDQVGSRIIDMGFAVALARLLFPDAFGLMAMAAASTAFFRLFANMGLGAAIVQRREVDEEYLSTAFWANLASGVVLFLLIAILGQFLGVFLRDPRVGAVATFLALRFVIAAGSATQVAMISRRMDYRALALRSIVSTMIGGGIAVILALGGAGVWSLVGQEIGRTLVNTTLLYRATGWRPRLLFSWRKFRDLWSFGGPILFSRLFGYLVRNSDNLLVGRYLGATPLGFYSLGFTIFAAPLNDFTAIVHRVMFSALSRLQGDDDRFTRGFLLATRYAAMILMPVMIGLAITASYLVSVAFGARWAASSPVVSVLALAGFVGVMIPLGPSGLQASGRSDLHLKGAILATLVYLPAFAIGLRWGIVGVAVGYLAGTVALMPFGYWFVAQATGVGFARLWNATFPAMASSLVMGIIVAAARAALAPAAFPDVMVLAILVVLGVGVYGLALWTVERQAVLGLVRVLRDALPSRGGRLVGQAE